MIRETLCLLIIIPTSFILSNRPESSATTGENAPRSVYKSYTTRGIVNYLLALITVSHFRAALLRFRLVGPKRINGVLKIASITFLLYVFFLRAMLTTPLKLFYSL